jgi:hypothetical protein
MKTLGWGFPAERLAWAAVEFGCDGVLREGAGTGPSGAFLSGDADKAGTALGLPASAWGRVVARVTVGSNPTPTADERPLTR